MQGHEGGSRPWGKADTWTHLSATAAKSLRGASALGRKRLHQLAGHAPRCPLPAEARSRRVPPPTPPAEPARPRAHRDAPKLGASDACGQPHAPTHFQVALRVAVGLPPRGAETLGSGDLPDGSSAEDSVGGARGSQSSIWVQGSPVSPAGPGPPQARVLLPGLGAHGLSSAPEPWPPPLPCLLCPGLPVPPRCPLGAGCATSPPGSGR